MWEHKLCIIYCSVPSFRTLLFSFRRFEGRSNFFIFYHLLLIFLLHIRNFILLFASNKCEFFGYNMIKLQMLFAIFFIPTFYIKWGQIFISFQGFLFTPFSSFFACKVFVRHVRSYGNNLFFVLFLLVVISHFQVFFRKFRQM